MQLDWTQPLLLIDKPTGITSFDVIRKLRKIYSNTHDGKKAPKMGHAGTLDPLATGLMLIGVGPGTKQLSTLTGLDKTYVAEVRFGERRSTGDLGGEVIEEKAGSASLELRAVEAALAQMVGTNDYEVSLFSAIKKDGVPLYKYAQGRKEKPEDLVAPTRSMTVYEASLCSSEIVEDKLVAVVEFRVASGTYIRSLAEALGVALGYPACLQALRRTEVGKYKVKQAVELKESHTV